MRLMPGALRTAVAGGHFAHGDARHPCCITHHRDLECIASDSGRVGQDPRRLLLLKWSAPTAHAKPWRER